jgi:hypothetical protein
MNKKQETKLAAVEPVHLTIAVSDAFMASACWFAAMTCSLHISQLGFAIVGSACTAGVLRFGFYPEIFRPFNENLAAMAGRVGIPLIGLGFLNLSPEFRSQLPLSDLDILFVLCLAFCITMAWSKTAAELYTTAAGVVSMGAILAYGMNTGNTLARAGVILFIVGGVVIGPERDNLMLGVRRENLFHYCLGTALVLICKAAPLSAASV